MKQLFLEWGFKLIPQIVGSYVSAVKFPSLQLFLLQNVPHTWVNPMLCFCNRCSACDHSSQLITHEQTRPQSGSTIPFACFHCWCARQNSVAIHIVLPIIVNMLSIPVCCDCGIVCSHTFLERRSRHGLRSVRRRSPARIQRGSID